MSEAPFAVGDTIRLMHSCGARKRPHSAELPVVRVTRMGGITGDWRIGATRCDGTPVAVAVDLRGFEVAL